MSKTLLSMWTIINSSRTANFIALFIDKQTNKQTNKQTPLQHNHDSKKIPRRRVNREEWYDVYPTATLQHLLVNIC